MANGNQKANENVNVENNQVQQTPEQPQNVQQPAETEEKGGFGAWCKRNWKKLVAGATGILAIGGSAVVAYKKGKAAGIMSVPVPQQQEAEDYSLNPNE